MMIPIPQRSHDTGRVQRVLQKLSHYGLRDFDLTGRLALETHARARGMSLMPRALNDIDLVVTDFATLPDSLVEGFLVRHVHPDSTAGRIVVQLVEPDEALRIDVFSAFGNSRARSTREIAYFGEVSVVPVEDLAARSGTLLMNLGRGDQVARKHFEDFRVLASWADSERAHIAWLDHRRNEDPLSFRSGMSAIASANSQARTKGCL
jgi:hypothetical protein